MTMKQLIDKTKAANPHPIVREAVQKIVSSIRTENTDTIEVNREVFNEIARITGNQIQKTWSWYWMSFFDDNYEIRVDIQYRDYLSDIAKPLNTKQ